MSADHKQSGTDQTLDYASAAPRAPNPDETLAYGQPALASHVAVDVLGATMTGEASSAASTPPRTAAPMALQATIAAPATTTATPRDTAPPGAATGTRSGTVIGRTTVLPAVEATGADVRLVAQERVRYERVKLLGAGGMGEVSLARDHDIGRSVAMKRLHANLQDASAMARFVDEIRTIGQLEHPNIVPIHDVGVDDDGQYFFVMKHLEGETLETVIQKLAAGDPAYHKKYTTEYRIEVFLGVLRALQFAHAQGIVHRDLKPANVMVGSYGEVVLMDWGIAKPSASASARRSGAHASERPPAPGRTPPQPGDAAESSRERIFATRHAALVGTPAYMSPEQARGHNLEIDERSDVYSACVMFHELLGLRHYLADKATVWEMLTAVTDEDPPIVTFGFYTSPHQPSPPAELLWYVHKGLRKDPAARHQTVDAMITELQYILEGHCKVQCYVTLTKRTSRELGRLVDRRPNVAFVGLTLVAAMTLFGLVQLVRLLVA